MDRNKRIGTLLVVMLAITLACAPTLPSVAPLPTQQVGAVDTMIAGTYAAASTSTALNASATPTGTDTPRPTWTATIALTPTATFILKTPTMAVTGGGGGGGGGSGGGGGGGGGGGFEPVYDCEVLKTTPAYGSHLARGKNFKTTWRVKNTGNMNWDHNSVDYKYYSEAKLHLQALYDIPKNVAPKGVVDLVVSMQAKNNAGTYITHWIMQVGDTKFCTLNQKIIVP